jgi:nucleoside-diphosphate-sugar epimerase
MKVLVTGSTGFIGSDLVPKLLEKGLEVYELRRYVTGRYSDRETKVVNADLNDHLRVKEAVSEIRPEYVIHLAAISPVAYSYEHYAEVLKTNFMASVNLAEVNRQFNPRLIHFLAAGTSEEYGIQESFPIRETADLRPNSPYAVSKVAMDRYLQYMRDAYDFPMTVLRPFNTYGRTGNTHFVVERIASQMMVNGEVCLGEPDPVRDLMFMDDHVSAYLTCLGNERAMRRTFNFCTGVGTSIRELVEVIQGITGWSGVVRWHTIPKRPLDIPVLVGDNQKARSVLGWSPKVKLLEGLEVTVKGLGEKNECLVTVGLHR